MFPFTLQQLRILKSIALEQSFTKASAQLCLSQPALSKQIQILEKNFKTKLIRRQRQTILLTHEGKILLNYSERILALCEESCRALAKKEHANHYNLRVGLNKILKPYFLTRVLKTFSDTTWNNNLTIQIDSNEKITSLILAQRLDISLVNKSIYGYLDKNFPVKLEHYQTENFDLVISGLHPVYQQGNLKKNKFYNLTYIDLKQNKLTGEFLRQKLTSQKINISKFARLIILDSLESVKIALILRLGITFLPNLTIETETWLKTVKIQVGYPLFIITLPQCANSKYLKLFYHELTKF